jgi:transposase
MADTVAKRIIGTVLLEVGVPDARVSEMTGMSDRSVRELRKKLRERASDDDLFRASGGGRKRKLKDIDSLIAEKIESNDYHTHQEIADMIYTEYGIKVHRSTVLRMLKKTASGG